ncbi:META domain-containing protein [Pedobacter punctiformis]|uniref:META domain-containing protein n=1 Tax=Pedobacter punctiformis TaxID=3004097 RepID=A0ABT4LCU4_9SPHI|nr:META domain-containing protein [Pedobacter sp. HCMS5-2]MCZ4244634.1 META domain-containing protein [Pedobacter sp. HCMS5-2]
MKNLMICGLVICLFSACLEKINPSKLTNTKWELVELPGLKLPATSKATLNFGEGLKVSGKSFCNNYGGQAEIKDNKVALKNVFGTKMFCQETADLEHAYLSALNETSGAKMVDGKLYLLNGEKTLLVFNKSAE